MQRLYGTDRWTDRQTDESKNISLTLLSITRIANNISITRIANNISTNCRLPDYKKMQCCTMTKLVCSINIQI